MEQTKKKTALWKKILLGVLAVLLVALILLWISFGSLVRTMLDLRPVDDSKAFFNMTYHGDYGFDRFLATGASTDSELVQFIVKELTHGIPLKFDLPDLGCSTFVAQNEEGDTLFGRNFDMYDSPAMMVTTQPDNGYRSISMVNLAYVGYSKEKLPYSVLDRVLAMTGPYVPVDGMNEKGLAVSVMLIDTEPTNQVSDKVDITTTTAIRMMLDKAATVEEAVSLLQQYDMHSSANSSYHFLIADASGQSALVEYIGSEMSVLWGEKISTNFLLTPGDYDFGAGQDRYQIIEERLTAQGGVLSEEDAMEVLRACRQEIQPDKNSSTQWSCVYNLNKLTVDVAIQMDYDTIYHFSLAV